MYSCTYLKKCYNFKMEFVIRRYDLYIVPNAEQARLLFDIMNSTFAYDFGSRTTDIIAMTDRPDWTIMTVTTTMFGLFSPAHRWQQRKVSLGEQLLLCIHNHRIATSGSRDSPPKRTSTCRLRLMTSTYGCMRNTERFAVKFCRMSVN